MCLCEFVDLKWIRRASLTILSLLSLVLMRSLTEGNISTLMYCHALCRIILETDVKEVTAKLAKQPAASKAFQSFVEKPLREQTLSSAFKLAKEQWKGFF